MIRGDLAIERANQVFAPEEVRVARCVLLWMRLDAQDHDDFWQQWWLVRQTSSPDESSNQRWHLIWTAIIAAAEVIENHQVRRDEAAR